MVRTIRSERERTVVAERKVEEKRRYTLAVQWDFKRRATECLLGWRAVIRSERVVRLQRERHRARVAALVVRTSEEIRGEEVGSNDGECSGDDNDNDNDRDGQEKPLVSNCELGEEIGRAHV